MKARDVVGRTIVGVRQQRYYNEESGEAVYNVDALVLDNGALVTFHVVEMPGDYVIEGTVRR